jgi:RNA polymerase sigma-70 factor, ECF subfamily
MGVTNHHELEKLFKEHHKTLSNLAYNVVRDREAAKDVVQEVFMRLWQNRERLDFSGQITHYLTKATAHTALNHLRSSRKLTSIDNETVGNVATPQGHDDYNYREFEQKVNEAIERLPPKCRTIYLLSRNEGLKYQQIADALDLSLKTVENQMGIALEKLRHDLKPFLIPISVALALIALFLRIFFHFT